MPNSVFTPKQGAGSCFDETASLILFSDVRRLIETHSSRNPRLLFFYGVMLALGLALVGSLAYRQLFRTGLYHDRERLQNQRRIIVPGPRGNIYDREGRVLVGNRPRFSVVLNLAELRAELRAEYSTVLRNYRSLAKGERPTSDQIERIARSSVAQRYLDQVNFILDRHEKVQARTLDRHFTQTLLLPFVLLDDLAPAEYARLIERLPVTSPLQVYASSTRYYPYGSAAAHTLGFVGVLDNPIAEDFPGDDLLTFKMKGSMGRAGLEKKFDEHLQGEPGGAIYRVDPSGYKVDLPIERRLPVQGNNLTVSLDIDLQLATEKAMEGRIGAAVVLDVKTGEVLVLASKPDYDLNTFVPRLSQEEAAQIEESGGWLNRASQGVYPAGSTFKIITAIAGLRAGSIDPRTASSICPGFFMVGARRFPCNVHYGHGERNLIGAIRDSCNVFFYKYGVDIGGNLLAAEARRFGLDKSTGIELPSETRRMLVADPAWKLKEMNERWFPGDSANMAIGQGFLDVTPLQIACFAASIARNETLTKPSILHVANRPQQHFAPIGLDPTAYAAIIDGMAQGYQFGTGRMSRVDGVTAGTKTGTAQKRTPKGTIEFAWMIAFAPLENPEIAIAICLESQEVDASFGGGIYSAPVVKAVLTAWQEKRDHPRPKAPTFRLGTE